jgi:DnaD/phage-associated family protein
MEMDEETIRRALSLATEHGIILPGTLDIDGKPEEAYSISPPLSWRAEAASQRRGRQRSNLEEEATLNIFALYEQNIGIITPMIAEELNEAERLYPPQWVDEAFKEAVKMNKRSWKYIARILERWASEGKEGGEYRKSAKEGGPNKYIRGKYGHLVKR